MALLAGLLVAFVPPPVADAPDAADDTVRLEPAVVRAPDGSATLRAIVGADAPDDVLVRWRLGTPVAAPDGVVTVDDAAPAGARLRTPGGRVRPGESLAVLLTVEGDEPVAVVGEVVPAATPDVAPTLLTALVLPGAAPADPPSVAAVTADDRLSATVTTQRPTVVALRLVGDSTTTVRDRLVLPGDGITVSAAAARWPLPSSVAVTDELDRVVRAEVGDGPVQLAAGGLVLLALVAVAVAARRRRAPDGVSGAQRDDAPSG